jgi:hypothetical protein
MLGGVLSGLEIAIPQHRCVGTRRAKVQRRRNDSSVEIELKLFQFLNKIGQSAPQNRSGDNFAHDDPQAKIRETSIAVD